MKLGDTIFNGNQFKNVILNSTSYKRLILGVNLVWSYFSIAIKSFKTRILADGGTYESESILEDRLQEITPNLFDSASLVITPNGVKTSKLYSIKPNDETGDLTVIRNTSATRIDENGNIVSVPANVARIDYSNGSPAILVEPQRTNLLLRSDMFDNATWTKIASSVTANIATSPSGVQDADKLVEDTTNNQHRIDQTTTSAVGTNTFSIFAKKAERDFIWLRIGTSGAYFDLTNGTFSGVTVGVTASIQSYPNGWYRCAITLTSAAANETIRINLATSVGGGTYLGNGTSGIYIWGVQLEAGSNATSYIPTTTSSVTRNADVITKSNIYTENLITSNGGTLFLRLSKNNLLVRQAAQGIFLNQLINNTGYGLHIVNSASSPSSGRLGVRKLDVNGNIAIYNTTESELKLLLKWNGSSLDIFQNGIKVVSNSSFLVSNMQFLSFQALDVVKNINNCILFPTALTDQECIALTTL